MVNFTRRVLPLRGRGRAGDRVDPSAGSPVVQLGDADSIEVTVVEAAEVGPGVPPGASLATAPDDATGAGAVEGDTAPGRPTWPPSWPTVRLVALAVLILLGVALSIAALVSRHAPTVDTLRSRAGWEDLQTLRVGVSGDVPGVSECLPNKPCTGFDVEIAKLVADRLGVPRRNVEFYEVLPENRFRMLGTRPGTSTAVHLDLVVAGFSITAERIERDKVVFAGPYLTTETTVLTRRDHAQVPSLKALNAMVTENGRARRQRVCTPGTSTSAGYLQQEVTGAEIVAQQRNSTCVALLRKGDVDATVTDAAILAGFQARYPTELRLNNIASTVDENWGIGLGQDFSPDGHDTRLRARQQLVLLALDDLRSTPGQEQWLAAYQQLPTVVVEPGQEIQVVADNQQPTPQGLEPIRRWPWERAGAGATG